MHPSQGAPEDRQGSSTEQWLRLLKLLLSVLLLAVMLWNALADGGLEQPVAAPVLARFAGPHHPLQELARGLRGDVPFAGVVDDLPLRGVV